MVRTGENSQRVIFRGNPFPHFLKQMCIGGLCICLLLALVLVGRFWFRTFLFFSIAIPPSVIMVWFGLRLWDWFYFDDQKERVVRCFRQNIPYQKITTIYMIDVFHWLTVLAKTGPRRSQQTPLVQVLDQREKRKLEEELHKRFPNKIVHRKPRRFSDWKSILLAMFVVEFVLCAALFVWMDLYQWTKVVPEKITWSKVKSLPETGRQHTLGSISFSVPENFEAIRGEEQLLVFRGKRTKTKLKVVLNSDIQVPRSLRHMMGMRDAYDFYRMTYYARFGIALLSVKAFVLSHLYDVRIFEIEQDGLKGFVVRGTRRGIDIAEIALVDRENGQEIDFTLSSLEPIDDETLAAIIASVQTAERSGD